MAYFKELSQFYRGGTEEYKDKPIYESGDLASQYKST
jgi:hypothetical protein